MGPAAPAAALIEQDDPVSRGIEKTPRPRVAACAGTAVQEDRRLAARIAALFPVNLVAVTDGQVTLAMRFDGRIESAPAVAGVIQNLYSSYADAARV